MGGRDREERMTKEEEEEEEGQQQRDKRRQHDEMVHRSDVEDVVSQDKQEKVIGNTDRV